MVLIVKYTNMPWMQTIEVNLYLLWNRPVDIPCYFKQVMYVCLQGKLFELTSPNCDLFARPNTKGNSFRILNLEIHASTLKCECYVASQFCTSIERFDVLSPHICQRSLQYLFRTILASVSTRQQIAHGKRTTIDFIVSF